MTYDEKRKQVDEMCQRNIKEITPFRRKYVEEMVEKVPSVIKAIIIFGSSVGVGNTNPDSDIDVIYVLDKMMDRHTYRVELRKYARSLEFSNVDRVYEDYRGLVEAMDNGNSLNQFYRTIWEEGLLVYFSDELLKEVCDG